MNSIPRLRTASSIARLRTASSRRELLRAATALAAGSALFGAPAARAAVRPRHLVVLLVDGGWDVTFALDPKLSVDAVDGPEVDLDPGVQEDVEEVRVFGGIPIVVNDWKRPAVTAFFEAWADRTAVINGIVSESIVHQDARARMLTGTRLVTQPDVATIVGHVLGRDRPLGTVDFSGRGFVGPLVASAGRVGTTSQLRTLVDPTVAFPAPPDAGYALPTYAPDAAEAGLVAGYLRGRLDRMDVPGGAANARALVDLSESYDRRDRLLAEAAQSLAGLVPGYWPELETQVSIATDLLANGVCQTVTLNLDGWDTHTGNSDQHALHERLFQTLDAIGVALVERDLFEATLVAVVSEMGRVPYLNDWTGKDHWPHTSALLFGGGVAGGRTYGATNDTLESEPADLASGDLGGSTHIEYDSFCAGLLAALDVDPGEWLPGVEAFRAPFV